MLLRLSRAVLSLYWHAAAAASLARNPDVTTLEGSIQIGQPLSDEYMTIDALSDSPTSNAFGQYHITMDFKSQDETLGQDQDQDQMGTPQDVISRSALQVEKSEWRSYFDSPECQSILARDRTSNDFVKCQVGKPMMYSPAYKFAYMKTPKVASTAFFQYFKNTFQDAYQVEGGNVPNDTIVFTFVRRPVEQKLSAFAEIDLKQLYYPRYGNRQNTTFQTTPATTNHGRDRFAAFLDDLENHRFQRDDKREPSHASSQLAGVFCTHKVDFIGRLDHAQRDWQLVQELAGLPGHLRTSAVPVVHDGVAARYKTDEHSALNSTVKKTICRLYPAEFTCLGYEKPEDCD